MSDDARARARAMIEAHAAEQYGSKDGVILWGERFVRFDAAAAVLAEVLVRCDEPIDESSEPSSVVDENGMPIERAVLVRRITELTAQRDSLAMLLERAIRYTWRDDSVDVGRLRREADAVLAAVRGGSDGR